MSEDNVRHTSKLMPVLIGNNYKHVMGRAKIHRGLDKVLIEIESSGEHGQLLADYLEQAEPVAVSFTAIPVQNAREKKETT